MKVKCEDLLKKFVRMDNQREKKVPIEKNTKLLQNRFKNAVEIAFEV